MFHCSYIHFKFYILGKTQTPHPELSVSRGADEHVLQEAEVGQRCGPGYVGLLELQVGTEAQRRLVRHQACRGEELYVWHYHKQEPIILN